MNVSEYYKKITDIFKKKKHRNLFFRDPFRDWGRILLGSGLVLTVIVAIDAYVFYKISRGEFLGNFGAESVVSDTLDKKTLETIVGHYTTKEQKFIEGRGALIPRSQSTTTAATTSTRSSLTE